MLNYGIWSKKRKDWLDTGYVSAEGAENGIDAFVKIDEDPNDLSVKVYSSTWDEED